MPILDINLLQQQQTKSVRWSQAHVVVGVVAGAILALQLLIVVFLFSSVAVRTAEKDSIVKKQDELKGRIETLDETKNDRYPGLTLTQQATTYQKQADAARKLYDAHTYFTLYLSEIALNTPTSVVYSSFGTDSQGKLSVVGTADSYSDVSKLVESFKDLSFAKATTLQDAKLDQGKVGKGQAVRFTMVIELKPASQLKAKRKAVPRTSPSPRPNTSPSPRVK